MSKSSYIKGKERGVWVDFWKNQQGVFFLTNTYTVICSEFGRKYTIGFNSIVIEDVRGEIPPGEMLYTNIKSINYNERINTLIIKGVTNKLLGNTIECVCTKEVSEDIKNHITKYQEVERSKLVAEKGEEALIVKPPLFTYGVKALGLLFLCLFAFLTLNQKYSAIPLIPTIIIVIASIVLLILNSKPKWYTPCKCYLILYIALILICVFVWGDPGSSSSNKSEWEKLDDSQKDWYIRNYGGGKSKEYDDAINSYKYK